ncbi:MAG: uroporphyrinogen decarboxylase family protein, partial [Eubacteriales bacterium]|nr:uroporphyrinogen decarboxylase family protein [Eubacteriales bacterium]
HGYGYGQPVNHPLQGASMAEIEAYPWPEPSWADASTVRKDALQWNGEYAILGGEWSPVFHDVIDLLGMENMMISMYEEPEKVHAVIRHVTDYYYLASQRQFEAAADVLDIFFMGNDIGSQTGPLLGEKLFQEFFAPSFRRLADLGHAYNLKVMMHICGAYVQLMPSLIACGIDAVQALQPITGEMKPASLKRLFGNELCFNGCIDSVDVLIRGTPALVRETTIQTLEVMMPGGGYILSPSHDYLLEETPVENILTLFDTCLEYGVYH